MVDFALVNRDGLMMRRRNLPDRLILTGISVLAGLLLPTTPCVTGAAIAQEPPQEVAPPIDSFDLDSKARKPREFVEGIQALEMGDWKKAAELMRMALETTQGEDGAITRVYGTKFVYYLPRYYLGFAHYKLAVDDPAHLVDNCAEAVKQWDLSEQQGEIVKRKVEYNLLLQYREECQTRLRSTVKIKMQRQPSSIRVVEPPLKEMKPPLFR